MAVHPELKFREDMLQKLHTELTACHVTPRHWHSRLWHELRVGTVYQGQSRDYLFRSPVREVYRTNKPIYSIDQQGRC